MLACCGLGVALAFVAFFGYVLAPFLMMLTPNELLLAFAANVVVSLNGHLGSCSKQWGFVTSGIFSLHSLAHSGLTTGSSSLI
jgi:hypothetical protein